MKISELFVAKSVIQPSGRVFDVQPGQVGEPTPTASGTSTGVFITPQSLTSFPVATGVVTAVWALAQHLTSWGQATWVPLVLSLVVGGVIFLINTSVPSAAPKSTSDWLIAISVAMLNSLFLCSASLGILGTGVLK
jgi:hypothetical protein